MSKYLRLEAENAKLRKELKKFEGLPKKEVDFSAYTHAQLVYECTNYQIWFERYMNETDELKNELYYLKKRLKSTIEKYERERRRRMKK